VNRFARTKQLLGREGFERLARARVAVFGLGAVGSYAVEALARAGVGHLRLVDFDEVNASNINRQLYALSSTVGRPKVDVARERVLDINPECVVDARRVFVDGTTLPGLLEGPLDAVVDAIDSVAPKIHLLREAFTRGLFVVSSMGAATRLDPSAVTVVDISQTRVCPLARFIRKRLHRFGIAQGVRCVFSPEPPRNKLPAVEEDVEVTPQTRGRKRRPIGSISYVTGVFGLYAAGEVIRHVLGMGSGA